MRILAFVGLVPALIAMPGAAETAPLVTEAQLLSKLDSDFPAVVERTRLLPLARARLLSERTLDNPELELGREDPDGPAAQTQWTLSWQLPGGSRRLEIAAAERSVDAATARAGHELRSLRSALREDYARWSVAWVRRQLLEKETDRLAVLAVRERARAEKGEASGLEAHRLELAAAALRARSSLAVADLKQAHARVGRWLQSLPAGARPGLPTLAPPAEPGKRSAPLSSDEPPLLSAARAELEAAELAHRASERFLSSPELTVGWQRQDDAAAGKSGPLLGLSWTLPLFDRNEATRGAALARLESARARAELTARQLRAQREAASASYGELVRSAGEARAALESSARMLHAAETSFRYGELPLTDLLETQRSTTDAHLAWLELHAAALSAHRELEMLAGPSALPLPDISDFEDPRP